MSFVRLPIACAWCERVRTGGGRWEKPDGLPLPGEATHGICPECLVAQTREAFAPTECR
jgi:hypothetical protein